MSEKTEMDGKLVTVGDVMRTVSLALGTASLDTEDIPAIVATLKLAIAMLDEVGAAEAATSPRPDHSVSLAGENQ